MKHFRFLCTLLVCVLAGTIHAQDTLTVKNVQAILYMGRGDAQPLLVGLGGSEGGNAWASDHWKRQRDIFVNKGYAFLAIGYFGCPGTPATLDRIALDDVYQAISTAHTNKQIKKNGTAIIGGSRGADLALLLGSHYDAITCVIAMSASHVVFPGNTTTLDHSSWTIGGKELPYVPVNEAALPLLLQKDLKGAFQAMMMDTVAEQQSLILVEKIKGPLLLMAGRNDEMIPAEAMARKMATRLKAFHFRHHYAVKIYDGLHSAPLQHFDEVMAFLDKYDNSH